MACACGSALSLLLEAVLSHVEFGMSQEELGDMRQVVSVPDVRRCLAGDALNLVCAKERISVYV